ncbi:PDZ domain-containing protein 9 [Anolis carolinensis]|uniref:PDZ domain-containing protein 9 n=1 Tax=Anolis carolinensis TaxID=28377 RepID=UPI002F2B5245
MDRRVSYFRRESSLPPRRLSVRRRSSSPRRPSYRRRSSSPRRLSYRRRSSSPRRPSYRRRSSSRGRSYERRKSSVRRRSSARRWSSASSEDEDTIFSASDDSWAWDSEEDSNMDQSEHTLSTTVKTNIQMEEDGLGLILIQNGPYLQIASLVEKSAAERDGKLQSGDTLLKIGHANVLGWTLRELRQLLHNTPIGTVLQIQVYRDFMKLPKRWEAAVNNIPEIRGPEIEETSSCASEEAWTSSEGSDEIVSDHLPCSGGNEEDKVARESNTVCFDEDGICTRTGVTGAPVSSRSVHSETFPNVRAVQSVSFEPSNQPKWISKDWHIVERKTYTFTVGSDIGCDIMIHTDSKEENEMDISSSYVTSSSPYWTMEKHHVGASSGSSSSVSDAFWLDKHAYEYE